MPELESSKHSFPILKHRKEGRRFQRKKTYFFFDMCILGWLQEVRDTHNLATCWPELANNKIEKGKNKPPVSDPPQVEIFLVLDHQSLQLTLEKSASLRNTENKQLMRISFM